MAEKKKSKWKLIVILFVVVVLLAGVSGVVIWLGNSVMYNDYPGGRYDVERYYAVEFPGFLRSELDVPAMYEGLPVLSVGGLDDNGPANGGNLKKLTVADGIKMIPKKGFQGCKKLAEIVLPDSIRDIGANAFEGTAYYNNEANWEDGALYIGHHLIKMKETAGSIFKVKQGTISIADEAFTGSKITDVELPSGLKRICPDAFDGCDGLKFHVTTVYDWAVIDKTYYDSDKRYRTGALGQSYELYINGAPLESITLNYDYFPIENDFPQFVYADCTSIKKIHLGYDWAKQIGNLNRILDHNSSIKDVYFPCTKAELEDQPITFYSGDFNVHFSD